MNGPTNGWQLLCIVVFLTVAATAVGAAQSTDTTANTTETPNTAPTTVAATTTTGAESPATEMLAITSTTTPAQSPTQISRSNQAINDDPDNATPIEVGERVTGRLPVGDQDWTKFSLESGGKLTVSVTAGNETYMSAFIYSSRNLLESTYVDSGEQVTLTATVDSGGPYYVFVRNEANDTSGTYVFEVSKSETPTNERDGGTPAKVTNSNGPGFGILATLGAVVLLGYLFFWRGFQQGD
jgi:hypothetical protein